ncbi:transmembrane protein [Cyclospora cayetanensis]|uniref:Transmembrane protein n=1 Tax=Cyclospora cayetanensis TaxID=88456 RepID=A0A1D3CTW1_9EIME|nr:transmembrane protein [Cyclospora cayetanensis]
MAAHTEERQGRPFIDPETEPKHAFLQYFDAEEKAQMLRILRCLYILWFFNVAATVASFALGLTITFHPFALNGAFNWRVVHTGCNVLLLALAVGLGLAGAHKGSTSLLYQSGVAHVLLSISSLLPFFGSLSVLLLVSGESRGDTPADKDFSRQLITALGGTGGVSAVVSLMCGEFRGNQRRCVSRFAATLQASPQPPWKKRSLPSASALCLLRCGAAALEVRAVSRLLWEVMPPKAPGIF